MNKSTIGQQPISKVIPFLKEIATEYGLILNRLADFKVARTILIQRYQTLN